MMKTIAIVYPDGRYLERLTLAMQKDLPEGFSAAGFTSAGEFAAWEEHIRVKALLLYEEVCEGDSGQDRDQLLEEMAGRRMPVMSTCTALFLSLILIYRSILMLLMS